MQSSKSRHGGVWPSVRPAIRHRLVYHSASEAETRDIAVTLARELKAGSVLLLSGDLGAGKTAFVRGLAEGLGISPDEVTSPTFTLVHEYRGGRLPLIHVDLYRLDRADLDEIGLDQDLGVTGVIAVEWAERLSRRIAGAVSVTISDRGGDTRSIEITSL
jgi:tRNA threonylcarbamoyladenosine biosynthesis protein TsaE